MTAVELFKYYLTGRHFTVVTDHASLTWLQNFKEPEVVVARWITRLQPFDFKIVHRPGKHHSHTDGLSHHASRPCKRYICPKCATLLHLVTPEEDRVRIVIPSNPYLQHFDGYLELVDSLFHDISALGLNLEQEPVSPELLWYFGRHPKGEDDYKLALEGLPERCNRMVLAMLRTVVSEQQDDWDDQIPALLGAYRSTPHSSTGVNPYHMLYGVEMTMPFYLVIGDVGWEWPDVHCPTEYVEWLSGSIKGAHAIARTNLKKAAKRQKKGYGETN